MTDTLRRSRGATATSRNFILVVAGALAVCLLIGAAVLTRGGATDPPAYSGVIEKVSPGGQRLELTVEEGGETPCIGVRNMDTGAVESVCGALDLVGDLSLGDEEFTAARVSNRLESGAESLGDCIRTAETTLADGTYAYWCMRG